MLSDQLTSILCAVKRPYTVLFRIVLWLCMFKAPRARHKAVVDVIIIIIDCYSATFLGVREVGGSARKGLDIWQSGGVWGEVVPSSSQQV